MREARALPCSARTCTAHKYGEGEEAPEKTDSVMRFSAGDLLMSVLSNN